MKIWKNTSTLDGYDRGLTFTNNKGTANIALMGSKSINIDEFPNLKGIFRVGVSTTNVPIKEAMEKNIVVRFPSAKTKQYIYEETADFTCGLIFNRHYTNLGTLDPWKKNERNALSVKTLLIIGEGRVGKIVKRKMSSFMNIHVFDPFIYPDNKLIQLLPDADFVSIHIPDTDGNKNFINSKTLSLMKDNAVLINTARGPIVDENALYAELNNKRLFAAFDVYWEEPYNGILKKFYPDRFMMTPHVASTCNEFLSGSEQDLRKFLQYMRNL